MITQPLGLYPSKNSLHASLLSQKFKSDHITPLFKISNAPHYLKNQIQDSQHDIQGPHDLASPIFPAVSSKPLCLRVTELLTIPHIDLVSTLHVFTHSVSASEIFSACSTLTILTSSG